MTYSRTSQGSASTVGVLARVQREAFSSVGHAGRKSVKHATVVDDLTQPTPTTSPSRVIESGPKTGACWTRQPGNSRRLKNRGERLKRVRDLRTCSHRQPEVPDGGYGCTVARNDSPSTTSSAFPILSVAPDCCATNWFSTPMIA